MHFFNPLFPYFNSYLFLVELNKISVFIINISRKLVLAAENTRRSRALLLPYSYKKV